MRVHCGAYRQSEVKTTLVETVVGMHTVTTKPATKAFGRPHLCSGTTA